MPIPSRFGVISIFCVKYSFFYQTIVLFEFLFNNHMQSTVDNNEIIKNKQINKKIFSMKSFTLKYFFVNLLVFYCFVVI
jgi:hypothetical protein